MVIYSKSIGYCILTLKSIFYNEFMSTSYLFDIFFEPLLWFVDHFSKILGPILVVCVVSLTAIIVSIVYIIGLPFYWQNYPNLLVILLIYGHYLLINVIFYYYQGVMTNPGTPPKGILITEAVSVCKKCIAPKPPRTHHCSVCNRCILKMDHHCPWMNNCIGHYNHRYFFMYMVYMILGILFIMIFGFEIAHKEIWLGGDSGFGWKDAFLIFLGFQEDHFANLEHFDGIAGKSNGSHFIPSFDGITGEPQLIEENDDEMDDMDQNINWYRVSILFTAPLVTGALFALLILVIWHGRQISNGETSIEAHINSKENQRYKKMNKIYKNPYNLGRKKNWLRFFGLNDKFDIFAVIVPSARPPIGNGLNWSGMFFHDKVV